MQPINANEDEFEQPDASAATGLAGSVADFPNGSARTLRLPSGEEVALYRINGEFYATENSCPHQGAPLANGVLCEYVIECNLHGWQFDVRSGECLTVPEKIKTYKVVVEDGTISGVVLTSNPARHRFRWLQQDSTLTLLHKRRAPRQL